MIDAEVIYCAIPRIQSDLNMQVGINFDIAWIKDIFTNVVV